MLFNIPEWPKDSDIEHYATTWILSRDSEGNDIEAKVEKSDEYLTAWVIDVLIPTGDIWYIKAKRHLRVKDTGEEVNNDKWIGPTPVMNEKTNLNDYLAPKFYITDPYLMDYIYEPGEKLILKLTPIETNVTYLETFVHIRDTDNNHVATKAAKVNENNEIIFDKDEIEFAKYNNLWVYIVNRASNSTISNVYKELIKLKKIYYKINGPLKNIDPDSETIFKLVAEEDLGLKLKKVNIYDLVDNKQIEVKFNNTEIMPIGLEYNKNYLVKMVIEYTDKDGNIQEFRDGFIASTRKFIEKPQPVIRNYENNFSKIGTIENYKMDIKKVTTVEEFFSHVIPLIVKDDDKVGFFVHDDKTNIVSKYKAPVLYDKDDNVIDNIDNLEFILINKYSGLMARVVEEDKIKISVIQYDYFNDKLIEVDNLTVDYKHRHPKFLEMGNSVYMVFKDPNDDDNKTIDVVEVKYDITKSDSIELIKINSFKFEDEIEEIYSIPMDSNKILLLPNGENEDRFYVYSFLTNRFDVSISIPSKFRNRDVGLVKIDNGNIVGFFLQLGDEGTDDGLDYMVVDIEKAKAEVYTNDNDGKAGITNLIKLKDGRIISLVKSDDKVNVWIFR